MPSILKYRLKRGFSQIIELPAFLKNEVGGSDHSFFSLLSIILIFLILINLSMQRSFPMSFSLNIKASLDHTQYEKNAKRMRRVSYVLTRFPLIGRGFADQIFQCAGDFVYEFGIGFRIGGVFDQIVNRCCRAGKPRRWLDAALLLKRIDWHYVVDSRQR